MGLKLYAINAYEVAKETGMGGRINTIMQTCFFYLSGILPQDEAIAAIKKAIKKTYGKRGEKVVQMNYDAVDQAIANLHEIEVPAAATTTPAQAAAGAREAPEFVQERDRLDHGRRGRQAARQPDTGRRRVADRYHPVGEAQHRPRDPGVGAGAVHPVRQVLVALPARDHPHQGLRRRRCWPGRRPRSSRPRPKARSTPVMKWTVQVAPEDCTGCGACVRDLPGQGQGRPGPQGHQHGLPAAAARRRARRTTSSSCGIPDPDRA